MGARALAVIESGPAGLDRSQAAAAAMAQRFAGETSSEADVFFAGDATSVPGKWGSAWSVPQREARTLVVELSRLLESGGYSLIVLGDTPVGREVAGRLAARLSLPVVGSALSVRALPGGIQVTRPAATNTRSAMLTALTLPVVVVASADVASGEATPPSLPEATRLLPATVFEPPALLSETRLSPWDMDPTEADVVVAGGRGVGGHDGFALLAELASRLGGAIAASRVAVDLGWAPRDRQVGLTGRSVAPRLYLACGISGAIHHTLGMRGSGFIVAINTDPRCPIFSIANASVVGDVREVVPALVAEIDSRRAAARPGLRAVGARP